jgi:ketosteroid isomerase-like protein
MSKENVELVRGLQPTGLDLVQVFSAAPDELASEREAELFTDDFEVCFLSGAPGMEKLEARGVNGLVAMWREWLKPWKSFRLDVEELIDAGDDVVVFARVQSRTARDDVLVEHSPTAVWNIREGKVAGITFYLDRAEALEAAGLSEQHTHADS